MARETPLLRRNKSAKGRMHSKGGMHRSTCLQLRRLHPSVVTGHVLVPVGHQHDALPHDGGVGI
jgi:hypothetical protein